MADPYRGATHGDSVDTRRYFAAIRRDLPLIAAIAAGLTVFAFALSLVLPKSYSAAALIGFDLGQTSGLDAATQERNLATQQELVKGRIVMQMASERALRDYKVRVTADELLDVTTASVLPGKNVLEIRSTSEEAQRATSYANAVADAFVARSKATQRASYNGQIRNYERAAREAALPELRQQALDAAQQLRSEKAAAESRVDIARAAAVPTGADSPNPIRNALLALFSGIFLGVLLALLRDQLRPRFNAPRDLGQFLGIPVIATIPELGRRFLVLGGSNPQALRVEHEAYQSLSAAVRLALPPSQNHVFMLTSSMHAEGKTTVAAGLARQLASSGSRTLLISGDLRWPRLDELMGVEGRQGFSDLLAAHQDGTLTAEQVSSAIVRAGAARTRGVDVIPAGTRTSDAAQLLSGGAVEPLLAGIRRLGYAYVVIDAPPLLGIADAMLLARACDQMLVVSRLERISVNAALDLRDEIERAGVPPLGLVAIGGVTESSPYYSGIKPLPAQPAAEARR